MLILSASVAILLGQTGAAGPASAADRVPAAVAALPPLDMSSAAPTAVPDTASDIVITASRLDLLGRAATASEGSITRKEVELRPVYRAAQIYESIPGLVVTVHSGEGKAQQYLIRGFNLDHGTDFANFVDDMPVNRPTNTHGQGYSDLNFVIPQIVERIDYTKGPYHAAIGDFGSVASSHTRLADAIPNEAAVTLGTDGYQDLYLGGTLQLAGERRVLMALDLGHYDGPWQPAQNFRKVAAALRYSQGSKSDGFSLTGLYYQSAGLLITDQPARAVDEGLIHRFGTLDPTDASRSLRYSVSAHVDRSIGPGTIAASLYAVHSTMTLWNNFTHYLDDPVNGDQEQQDETRTTVGGTAAYTLHATIAGLDSETIIGFQARYDSAFVDRKHTRGRATVLGSCQIEQADGPTLSYPAVGGNCNADRVALLDIAPYAQETLRFTPWLRVEAGLREEFYHATDTSAVTAAHGEGHEWLLQPKGSLILGPWAKTEFYFSLGRGFHSDDVRGVFGIVPQVGNPLPSGPTALLAQTTGYEVGLRSDIAPHLAVQLAAFQQDFRSELTYNADSGQDQAGAPSRRQGVELSSEYRPLRWLELNADLAFVRARYRAGNLAAYGLAGPFIANAPASIFSAGMLVDHLAHWSGSLVWRRLGREHISDGAAAPTDPGYSEWNLDVGYMLPHGWRLSVDIFNLFDTRSDGSVFYYVSRLPGEPTAGVADFQVHPLEPRSARFVLTKKF